MPCRLETGKTGSFEVIMREEAPTFICRPGLVVQVAHAGLQSPSLMNKGVYPDSHRPRVTAV